MSVTISTNCLTSKSLNGLLSTIPVEAGEAEGKPTENDDDQYDFEVDSIDPDICVELRLYLFSNIRVEAILRTTPCRWGGGFLLNWGQFFHP